MLNITLETLLFRHYIAAMFKLENNSLNQM